MNENALRWPHDDLPVPSPSVGPRPEGGWFAEPFAAALARLGTGPDGLSSIEAAARLAACGPNMLPARARRSLAAIVLAQLASPLIYLLLLAAAVSLGLGEYKDAVFVFLVLTINTAVGALQEAKAESNTAALGRSIRTNARALRDGTVRLVDGESLVPGDVVLLEAGDRVPADIRVLRSADLQTDEASLTGESTPVDKAASDGLAAATPLADRLNMLHAGSSVQRGRAEGIIVATGLGTELGRIAEELRSPQPPPPLIRRLSRFSRNLGIAALVLVGFVVALRLAGGAPMRETFFLAVALAISVIPEGLPVAITVALSIATHRMAKRNVIVRQLPAVEGLGACTVVATDKTGTLTVNRLTAKRVWLPEHGTVLVGGEGFAVEAELAHEHEPLRDTARPALAALGRSAALCNNAAFDPCLGAAGASGDTVDLAFWILALKALVDVAELRAGAPRVAEIPFDAQRKYAATLNRHVGAHHLHVKGAAEVIVPLCSAVDVVAVLAVAERMASDGYRVLAVATKEVDGDVDRIEDRLAGLNLLGLVGFIDPLRPEAKAAVADCRRAGVAVKMITGDHAATALAIARELGIADTADAVVTGLELTALAEDPAEARARIGRAAVFARVEPRQKVDIVEWLRADGHVVAMTGDGVNDAPALQRADLGVAMGRDGTDVARDAADLVLTDDNFASIVAGIEEGRAAYANIRKVTYLLISTGAAEVVLFLLAIGTGLPVPLTAVQLLWLNLVTNGGQDVALAFEQREPGLLDRPPRRRDEAVLDAAMVRATAISGIYMGLVAYGLFAALVGFGWSEFAARNLLLFLMVLFENVHVFNCRSEIRSAFGSPLSANRPLIAAVAGAQVLHVAAAYIPGLRDVLEVEPITPGMWLLLVPAAASVLAVMEMDKRLRRRGRS